MPMNMQSIAKHARRLSVTLLGTALLVAATPASAFLSPDSPSAEIAAPAASPVPPSAAPPSAAPASAASANTSAAKAPAPKSHDAAADFDGRWRVTSNMVVSGPCQAAPAISFNVANGQLRGPGLSGGVDAQGHVSGRYTVGGTTSALEGQISGNAAAGGWRAGICRGRWTATRVAAN